jgi:arginine-tRNA-protein transferase
VRIPVNQFRLSRKQKRVLKLNQDLEIRQIPGRFDREHYELYESYIRSKHQDGDMYPPNPEQYASFLLSDWGCTVFFEFRLHGRLLAVAVSDIMHNGVSAVYTFYDITETRRSLGVLAVIWQIQRAIELGLPAVYLGYWIKECQKMSYKTEYRPLEAFIDNHWTLLPEP